MDSRRFPTQFLPMASRSPAARRTRLLRWEARGKPRRVADSLAVEEPLELRVDGQSIAVVMRTPGHDEDLAAGFLLTEGVIRSGADLQLIRASPRNEAGNLLDVVLADGVRVDLRQLTRHVFAASSCGLCGKASIAAIRRQFPRVRAQFRVPAATLPALPAAMRAAQTTFAATGGLHAAALFDRTGRRLVLREDVGRHNAVDKVLGWRLRQAAEGNADILLVSGRASFEILQKALAARIPVVAAVSAPSSLAVEFARSSGQTLVGFLRDDRFNVYAGAGRIDAGAAGTRVSDRRKTDPGAVANPSPEGSRSS